jgi:transcriptional regulator GlxA family with amidase domain
VAFLRRQRLERAIALLDSTVLPVGEVAARVGLSRLALWRGVRALRGAPPRERQCHNRAISRKTVRADSPP